MRNIIDLNGLWDFVVDLDPKYHTTPNYAKPDWNRRHWQKVSVPGVWNLYAEKYSIYEGVCWFAREFTIPTLPDGSTALLRFGAVNYRCEVFVNGERVGEHEGGYTEFVIDVSPLVHEGDNYIAVKVDNRATSTRLPGVLGYFNYGGIHRDVTLEIYPAAYLADVFVRGHPKAGGGVLQVTGKCGAVRTDTLEVVVSCNGVREKATVALDGTFAIELDVPDVQPWSPENPNLYHTVVTLGCGEDIFDEWGFDVGFRALAICDSKIQLNGQGTFLKGICYIYDSPAFGLVLRPEQFERDIILLKELGVNAIRSHFPLSHSFLNACDRAGIMVWVEIPVYCIFPGDDERGTVFADAEWQRLAMTMLEEMITQAKNHPSVILYGIGNECNLKNPEAEPFFRNLAARARELDPTRLLSYACAYGNTGPMADIVDILGINEYWGWYDVIFDNNRSLSSEEIDLKKLDDLLQKHTAKHRKPLLLTEFGADAIPGYLSQKLALWSEDYQAEFLRKTYAVAQRCPRLCGTFPFGFADYRDPSKEINEYWDGMNYKGVVTYNRKRKRAFFALKSIYGGLDKGEGV